MTKKKNKGSLANCIKAFAGLKLVEIFGLVAGTIGVYWLGRLSLYIFGGEIGIDTYFEVWLSGISTAFCLLIIGVIIYAIIDKNWEWAKELSGYEIKD